MILTPIACQREGIFAVCYSFERRCLPAVCLDWCWHPRRIPPLVTVFFLSFLPRRPLISSPRNVDINSISAFTCRIYSTVFPVLLVATCSSKPGVNLLPPTGLAIFNYLPVNQVSDCPSAIGYSPSPLTHITDHRLEAMCRLQHSAGTMSAEQFISGCSSRKTYDTDLPVDPQR